MLKRSTVRAGKVLGAVVAMVAMAIPAASSSAAVRHVGATPAAKSGDALRALLPSANGRSAARLYVPRPGGTATTAAPASYAAVAHSIQAAHLISTHARVTDQGSGPLPAPQISISATKAMACA
jgi:hypothetical protein